MRQLKSFLCAIVLMLLTSLSGCSGEFLFGPALNDWTYDALPGDYVIWRVNSKSIILLKQSDDGTINKEIVGAYISKIAYNEDYIFVQQTPVSENKTQSVESENPNFYIIVVADDSLSGPYLKVDFLAQYDTLELDEALVWINSEDLPNREDK